MKSFFKSPVNLLVLVVYLAGPMAIVSDRSSRQHFLTESQAILSFPTFRLEHRPAHLPTPSHDLDLLLHGNLSYFDVDAGWLAVFESHSESAIHFARYVQKAERLPRDYRQIADRLAPENGWFDFWEVVRITPTIIREREDNRSNDKEEEDSLPSFEILDEEQFQHCLTLLHQAVQKDEFTNYFSDLLSLLLAEIPPPKTWVEQVNYLSLTTGIEATHSQGFMRFTEAACEQFRSKQDPDGFLRFENDLKAIAGKLHADCHTIISAIILDNWLRSAARQLSETARSLNLPHLEDRYEKLALALEERKETLRSRRENAVRDQSESPFFRYGSVFMMRSGMMHQLLPGQLPDRGNLKPSVRAEKALFSRAFTTASFILLSILGFIAWIKSHRSQKGSPVDGHDSASHLRPADRLKVATLGAVLPFSLLLLVRYLTPLGQLDYGIVTVFLSQRSWVPFHIFPFLASILIIGAALIVSIRHTTRPSGYSSKWDGLLIGLPVFAYLMNGCYLIFDENPLVFHLAVWPLLISLGWLITLTITRLYKKDPLSAVKCSLAISALFFTAGLFGLWTWALTWEERYWISVDDLGTPAGHFPTQYEADLFSQYHQELAELLP